jgi:hypothetical protein
VGYNSLSKEQTLIKYDYYNRKNGKIFFGEQTGIAEDSNRIFIHPPREYAFIITEFCPFPRVEYPLYIGKEWTGSIFIEESMMRRAKWLEDSNSTTSFESEYKVLDTLRLDTPFEDDIFCYRIFAKNTGELGESSLEVYFNPRYGFIKMDYENIDSSRLSFEMVDVK